MPGYAPEHIYNYIALAFWTCQNGPLDLTLIWKDPLYYMGADNPFGSTNGDIQKKLKKIYNDNGVKIMISAFGATEHPTSSGMGAVYCANKLGEFVL